MKGDSEELSSAANQLDPNIQFTLEKANGKGNLAFPGINVNVDTLKKIICGWFQKSNDTWTILNFRRCASLHYQKNIIEGAVRRIFRSNSTWNRSDEAMKVNREQWVYNRFPKCCTEKIISRTLDKFIKWKVNQSPGNHLLQGGIDNIDLPTMMVMQYRCNESLIFAKRCGT